MPTQPRLARVASAVVLSLSLIGCSTDSSSQAKSQSPNSSDACCDDPKAAGAKPASATPADGKPAWTHGGVMANNTNKAFVPKPSSGTLGKVERLDPAMDQLLAADAQMEKLIEGLDWSEGPVWDKKTGSLYFSDVPQNVVYQWKQGAPLSEFLRPSGYTGSEPRGGEPGSNGLTIDSKGRLFLCQHGDRRVAVLDSTGISPPPESSSTPLVVREMKTVADNFEGKKFNSPNDLCIDRKGNVYFTDPPYGLPKNVGDPTKEIPFQGVYRVATDGKVTLLTKEMSRPNGVALSPDEKTLYIANSDPKQAIIKAFPLEDDGTLGEGKVLFDATALAAKAKGLPDGLKVDINGNLWATGPGGVLILTPEGKHLGTLNTGEATANVAFGDDGSTLYICADMYIARIKTKAKGW